MWTIKNVSMMTGIGVHTLRAWEKRYGLVSPKRNESGRRTYSDEEVEILSLLAVLTKSGTPIGQLAPLTKDELQNLVNELPEEKKHSDLIEKLESSLLILKKAIELNVQDVVVHEIGSLNKDIQDKKFDSNIFLRVFVVPFYQWILQNEDELKRRESSYVDQLLLHFRTTLKSLLAQVMDEKRDDVIGDESSKVLIGSSGGAKGEIDSLILCIKSFLGGKNTLFIGNEIDENIIKEFLNQMGPEKIILTDRVQGNLRPPKVVELLHGIDTSSLNEVEVGLLIHSKNGDGMESPFIDTHVKTFSSFDSIEKFLLAS